MTEHPFGVKPLGNLLSSDGGLSPVQLRRRSLGSLAVLPDALLVRVLDVLVSTTSPVPAARALLSFSGSSISALAFASDEDLWRRLVFLRFTPTQIARGFAVTWRDTFLALISGGRRIPRNTQRLVTEGVVYSDVLFHKWRCQTADIDPVWLSVDNVPRISGFDTAAAVFRKRFERPGVPVVITDVVEKWPAFRLWTRAALDERCSDATLHAGGFEFTLRDYFRYCDAVEGHDDQPLYVFDKRFAEKVPELGLDYDVPEYFAEDLFKVLGEHQRPDYRWLIIGPARSGSSFHKDPNATSAWNAVIKGEKKWILFPPDCPPPGVHPSGDEGDVTAPVSITEWFLNFYDRETFDRCGARECVVKEGEIIFVPMGWWHCVLNTTTSIAITQNYVSSANVQHVAAWLRNRPSQVSGCQSKEQARFISKNFSRLVVEQFPDLHEKLRPFVAKEAGERDMDAKDHASLKTGKTGLWETLQTQTPSGTVKKRSMNEMEESKQPSNSQPAFSFGF